MHARTDWRLHDSDSAECAVTNQRCVLYAGLIDGVGRRICRSVGSCTIGPPSRSALRWATFAGLANRSSRYGCHARAKGGGPDRDRTGDLLNAIQARSQLRYRPTRRGTFDGSARPVARQPDAGRRIQTLAVRPRLYSGSSRGRCRDRSKALVRQRQPLQQQPCRLVRRRAVEGHHGGGHPRPAPQLGPPPVADGRDFDLIGAAADGLFEVMNDHVCITRVGSGAATILVGGAHRSSEGTHEAPLHSLEHDGSLASRAEKLFAVRLSTGFARFMHRISTTRHASGLPRRRYNTDSPP